MSRSSANVVKAAQQPIAPSSNPWSTRLTPDGNNDHALAQSNWRPSVDAPEFHPSLATSMLMKAASSTDKRANSNRHTPKDSVTMTRDQVCSAHFLSSAPTRRSTSTMPPWPQNKLKRSSNHAMTQIAHISHTRVTAASPRRKQFKKAADVTIPEYIGDGAEHDLLRLVMKQGGHKGFGSKGRQRVRPRRKRFSSLKKKVLEERLRKWRSLHPIEPMSFSPLLSRTVCLLGFADYDMLQDPEEIAELTSNLYDMGTEVGAVQYTYICRSTEEHASTPACFVEFEQQSDAAAAASCWDAMILAGILLKCRQLPAGLGDELTTQEDWEAWCCTASTVLRESSTHGPTEVAIDNILNEDDLEDEECLEETIQDVRRLAEQFGRVRNVRCLREPTARLVVEYDEPLHQAREAAAELCKQVIAGARLVAKPLISGPQLYSLMLYNILTDDDLEDNDCLLESLQDTKELAAHYGPVDAVELAEGKAIRVVFRNLGAMQAAMHGLNGMSLGGASIRACDEQDSRKDGRDFASAVATKANEPMYSGDKLIPERFAECKRVPKIPNSTALRHYARLIVDPNAKGLLVTMLGELARLQKRAYQEKNVKARRRLVLGLREVTRGIRAKKVKMVIMANNLDEYGALDDKIQEIIDMATAAEVPVVYELSRKGLGRAVNSSLKVAVVGVQNVEGAHQEFKQLLELAQQRHS